MSQPAVSASADEPARPEKPEDENDYFGTDNYFDRDRYFTDQPPAKKVSEE